MMNINEAVMMNADTSFGDIAERVSDIMETENTYTMRELDSDSHKSRVLDFESYSKHGFSTLGVQADFPVPFMMKLRRRDPQLAGQVLESCVSSRLTKGALIFREFKGKIRGAVSEKYSYFDDDQVIDIISKSKLKDMNFKRSYVIPERLHLCAVKNEKFKIPGDESDLQFAYFIDNSMVGGAAFKIRLGLYRLICSNGLVIPQKEFQVCKVVHRGSKNISEQFNENLEFLASKEGEIIEMLTDLSKTESNFEELKAEFRTEYLARKLAVSRAAAENIFMLYKTTYGGKTKWDMVNAITEYARDLTDVEKRIQLESHALNVESSAIDLKEVEKIRRELKIG